MAAQNKKAKQSTLKTQPEPVQVIKPEPVIITMSDHGFHKIADTYFSAYYWLYNLLDTKQSSSRKTKAIKLLRRYHKVLKDRGRVFVRYSGTENLARVLVEAQTQELAEQIADSIADEIKKEVGL